MDEIEKILQQYGEDRRQQADVTRRIHRKARSQRSVLAAMACVVVISAVSVWFIHRQTEPQLAESTITVRQSVPDPQSDTSMPDAPQSDAMQHIVVAQRTATRTAIVDVQDDIMAEAACMRYAELPSEQQVETETETEAPQEPAVVPDILPLVLQLAQSDVVPTEEATGKIHQSVTTESVGRWSMMASVGACAMSHFSPGVSEMDMDGITSNDASYISIAPVTSFTANMGVSYTLLKRERFATRIGFVVSGQAQQGEVESYDLEPLMLEEIDGIPFTRYEWVENQEERASYSSFCLYAGIPFVIDLQPQGSGHAGWSLMLTPSHSVLTSQLLGVQSVAYAPNPWKMTLGVGVTLPRRFPRRISLTANLLPVSKSVSMHEIGIEVGF